MTLGGEPLGQVPVPALGAADGVRIDAVVDDADPHAAKSLALWPRRTGAGAGVAGAARLQDTAREMAIDTASSGTRRFTATALRVSVVIPCLNEAENIAECVRRASEVLERNELPGEVIVVDNGSDDGSAALARAAGATVIEEPRRGYGQAYLTGFEAASRRLHRDDRRRPHLRLRGDPPLRRRARRRRRAGDGEPDERRPARRDVDAQQDRQPDPHRLPEPRSHLAGEGRPLRAARASP